MNQVYVCLFVLLFESFSSLSAQVVSTSTGYPVIDLTALTPLGCVLSSSEAVARREAMYAPNVIPSNDKALSVGLDVSGTNGTWNVKMSAKYQVMRQNHVIGYADFATAWNVCKTYNGEGGNAGTWRLPTQRELRMIWVLYPQLIGKAGFTVLKGNNGYTSSTEDNASNIWSARFDDGVVGNWEKTTPRVVRCVRDL